MEAAQNTPVSPQHIHGAVKLLSKFVNYGKITLLHATLALVQTVQTHFARTVDAPARHESTIFTHI